MTHPESCRQPAAMALVVLAILQGVMLAAMLARVPPHPPFTIALFAMGPWLGACLAAIAVSLMCGAESSRAGKGFALLSTVMALVSYGPQKWVDPAIGQIWPAVLAAQIACATILIRTSLPLAIRFRRKAQAVPS
ncbi:MAG: hypothetical protein KDJ73_14170 [Notoacmeibacter sp.]|nr:hypothetical protein [Notoacmeibacter sp.]